ncbi:HAMP domain-containing protein, partial [bacterium]
NGVAVAATISARSRLGHNYAFRPYFAEVQAQKGPVFSTFLEEVPSGTPAVVIAVPVMQGGQMKGQVIGVLFVEQHLWPQAIRDLETTVGAQAFLVDSQGTIIYHTRADQIGSTLKDDPLLVQVQAANQVASRLDENDSDGGRVISYAPIGTLGWGVMVIEPWQTLMQPAMRYLYIIPGIILIGLALSVLLLLWVLRRTLSPLSALMEEAQRVADGGDFREAPVDGPPEISLLLSTFNRMMANQRSQREALRNYAKKILESQEEERKRISRDLHDETVQDLVGLSQRLELCRLAMVKDPQGARNRLDELQTLINRALIDVRRMSNDLRPSILEDLGLVAAARAMCQSLQQDLPTAEIAFQVVGVSHRLPDELELATYRVIQEALSNIRRHARSATRVQVEIEFKENSLSARIEDNGPGFEAVDVDDMMQQGHLGLAGMNERISLFDGRLDLVSSPGSGTSVRLLLPYSPTSQAVPN